MASPVLTTEGETVHASPRLSGMDAESDAPSLPETVSPRKPAGRGTPRRGGASGGRSRAVGGDDALLSLKEQCAAARAAERAAEDKSRQ